MAAEAATSADAVRLAREHRPDIAASALTEDTSRHAAAHRA
ncbi:MULTISPECIES: hypothetical protein [unclassified Nonomuraea]|nr:MULTISPECIES: hypothetical protein [unclassified Nonomuraea]